MARLKSQNVLAQFNVDPDKGLSTLEAKSLLAKFGPNILQKSRRISKWTILWRQVKSPVIFVLLFGFIIALFVGDKLDAFSILAVVMINILIGFFQEAKTEDAMDALSKLAAPKGRVIRDGQVQELKTTQVTPGDILVVESGDYVMGDAVIFEAQNLTVDESILTGESKSVEKQIEDVPNDAPLAERFNMIFAGTAISSGSGKAVVVATGSLTEMGKIAALLEAPNSESTPLEKKLQKVSQGLLWIGLAVIGVVVFLQYQRHKPWEQIVMSALSLAVAAIPEGLPTVVTIALVLAVRRMSGKKALVRRLDAVETLGTSDIICTDKTGTLTTGKMIVVQEYVESPDDRDSLFENMVLCNNAALNLTSTGDSTEVALLNYAQSQGKDIPKIVKGNKRIKEWSFDSHRKRMSVAVTAGQGARILVKGAPEALLSICDGCDHQKRQLALESMVSKGMRILAFGSKDISPEMAINLTQQEAESGLKFLGFVGMDDPPRKEAIDSIKKCQDSGIRVVMITGDHPVTAQSIAEQMGIISDKKFPVITGKDIDAMNDIQFEEQSKSTSIYARVSPDHKLRLVQALIKRGHVVAMTGDGVNDAPALKHASIGISMGHSGTEVARQASKIVLTDDNFTSIVDAIEEGRAVHGNIKRALQYLLSTNLAELLFILGATLLGMPSPLLPVNILWLNLVTDGLPSLALAAEKIPDKFLEGTSRPSDDTFMNSEFYREMFLIGIVITLLCLGVFQYALTRYDVLTARSYSFALLVYCVLLRSISCTSERQTFFETKINFPLIASIIVPLIFQLLLQTSEVLLKIFKVKALSVVENLILLGLSLIPVTVAEIYKLIRRRFYEDSLF